MNNILKSNILNETMHIKTLPSGLCSYIIPKKGFNEKFGALAVNFGSCDLEFNLDGKKITTPEGIAHFLEHKVFEDEKLDYFNEFTKLSGSVNAYTNFNTTVYYFSCTDNFTDCLKLLFDMVYSLYLTDETVEKEKGIIEQEISMYDDDPSWRVYFNMLGGLYKNSPVRNEIAGSAASIAKIDQAILRLVFDSFYVPKNMALICSGDFELSEVYNIAQEKTADLTSPKIERIYPEEPSNAPKDSIKDKMHISKPLFCLGFKDAHNRTDEKQIVTTKILLDIIIGGSSETYNKLYKTGLLDDGFSLDYSHGSCYSTTMFSGTSKDPDTVFEEIINAIKTLKETGINPLIFERIKKKHLGRFMQSFNSVSTPSEMQADFFVKGFNIFDLAKALKDVKIEDVHKRMENCFTKDNFCISIVDKLE
ncbi:MAG: insulinase family protein [Defluviitaleaceae bacterium]|nr:insulinase family protein [Defluviitaleaceae bacterium]